MHTYLLNDIDVRRYAQDFLERIAVMGDNAPAVWVSLGLSGDKMLDVLDVLLEEQGFELPPVVLLSFDRSSNSITYRNADASETLKSAIDQKRPILLIDSAVHSGRSMRMVVDHFVSAGIPEVVSYTLILKQSSEFIPTFFGIMIGAHDRAFFQLASIPNHRLNPRRPVGSMRMIRADDAKRSFLNTETASINKMSYGDLLYLSATQNFSTYIYEIAGKCAGVITFKARQDGFLFIELIARDLEWEAAKIGGLLLRWAETYARHANCVGIELVAVESAVPVYSRFFFEPTNDAPLDLGTEKYYKMSRRLLYNIRPSEQVTLDYLNGRR